MEIKSRELLPNETVELEEEFDPRDDLIRRLLEYKRSRDLARELDARADRRARQSPLVLSQPAHLAGGPLAKHQGPPRHNPQLATVSGDDGDGPVDGGQRHARVLGPTAVATHGHKPGARGLVELKAHNAFVVRLAHGTHVLRHRLQSAVIVHTPHRVVCSPNKGPDHLHNAINDFSGFDHVCYLRYGLVIR